MTKIEKLREVNKTVISLINDLEVYIFRENIENILENINDSEKSFKDMKNKTINKTIYT